MIGKLTGVVETIFEDHLILDVKGVGYRIFMPQQILHTTKLSESYAVFIHTDVKEDSITLFGFLSMEEKDAFLLLKSVNGIGPKAALAILSNLQLSGIQNAILQDDKAAFTSVPGIGPKLAGRIILELKNKHFSGLPGSTPTTTTASSQDNTRLNDAVSALVNLGISKANAENIVKKLLSSDPNITLSELIRTALQTCNNI